MIVIIDYGLGNLDSVSNMIRKIGYESTISSNKETIKSATKLILPGVGSFDNGMTKLKDLNLIDILNHKILEKRTPILGICLGMQLMTKRSDEGELSGFGWIDAETIKFNFDNSKINKVPHMGWNFIKIQQNHPLFNSMNDEFKFYFVHSYYVKCNNNNDSFAKTNYGIDFTSVFVKDNIMATQFHPEKSHKYGMNLLKNFIKYVT